MPILVFNVLVSAGQAPPEIKGEAILKHPIGVLALTCADLLTAGKIDEVIALSTAPEQADWKRASAANRDEMIPLLKKLAPEPKAFAAAIRSAGIVTTRAGTEGDLVVPMGASNAVFYFNYENSQWRRESGPRMQ